MKFLTGPRIWNRITQLSGQRGTALVASPYIGKGAAKMLPLNAGSILITRFELSAISAGQVCPQDVLELLHRGIRVFNSPSLHAKIYLFPKVVVLGSSNASHTSRDRLLEACVETNEPRILAQARSLLMSLLSDPIDENTVRAMLTKYRAPAVFPLSEGKSGLTVQRRAVRPDELSVRPLWLLPVVEQESFSVAENGALAQAKEEGLAAAKVREKNCVETLLCPGNQRKKLEVGDMVLIRHRDKTYGSDMLSPPARILSFRKVRGKDEFALAYVWRPGARDMQTEGVLRKLGDDATTLKNLVQAIRPAKPHEREALLRLWPAKLGK